MTEIPNDKNVLLSKNLMQNLPSRNNTNFGTAIHKAMIELAGIYRDADYLKLHQRLAHDYLMYSKVRGILAYHNMGAGKSILAAQVAYTSVSQSAPVVFISIKSLHINFSNNLEKLYKMGNLQKIDESYFRYLTLNASNLTKQVAGDDYIHDDDGIIELDDSGNIKTKFDTLTNPFSDRTIIVDEAHIFFNSITNGSSNAVNLYNLLKKAQNSKILFLTGTPIINSPFEITLCYNMLAGGELFTEFYEDFQAKWISNSDSEDPDNEVKKLPRIKNADKFMDRIQGLTSYYNISKSEEELYFPTKLDMTVVDCPMSDFQFKKYQLAREKEIEEASKSFKKGKPAALNRSSKSTNSSYRIFSRQTSNFVYPDEISYFGKKDGRFVYEKDIEKLRESNKGEQYMAEKKIRKYSEKIWRLLVNVAYHLPEQMLPSYQNRKGKKNPDEIGPGLIYTQFVENGVIPVSVALEADGFSLYDFDKKVDNPTYAVISGEIDPEIRNKYLEVFNSKENEYGDVIALLIYTSTGAQGLDTKRVRHTHALEPYWNKVRIDQHEHRAYRFQSHSDLPKERRTIRNYIYVATYPKNDNKPSDLEKLEKTTDYTMYRSSLITDYNNNSFLLPIQSMAIDCGMYDSHDFHNKKCRRCKPTNRTLFTDNLDFDINLESNCQVQDEDVDVVEMDLSGVKFYYSESDSGKYRFFRKKGDEFVEVKKPNKEYDFLYNILVSNT